MTTYSDIEKRVLAWFASLDEPDCCYGFAPIMGDTKLTRTEVRRACRSLKRKGLLEYERGLWSECGPAGAGYGLTRAGREAMK